MMTLDDTFTQKSADIFFCKICDFKCSKKNDMYRHLSTPKHKTNDKMMTLDDAFTQKSAMVTNNYICVCGRQYKYRQGLFKHKNKCSNHNKIKDDVQEKKIILTLLQQNNELQNQIIEMCNGKNNITNINNIGAHINSHNKTFNLNVFLNETCKDAMNITDFVDSLNLQLSDLESIGRLGYVEGISNIIIKNLKALDIHKRPVHCSDSKREVMYIKDENKWEKENDEKNKLRKVIKKIANKNSKLLPEFKAKHPDCIKSASPFSDQYNKLIIESMGGSGDNDTEKEEKIIKNITKNIVIDK